MSKFDTNLSALKNRNIPLADAIAASDSGAVTPICISSGDFVAQADVNGKKIMVHSKFDPVKEAERFVNETDASAFDLIVVFGFGYAYHIEALMSRMRKGSVLLVIEKLPSMIKSAMENRDLHEILADSRLVIKLDPDEDELAESLRGKSSYKVSFMTHRGSFQVDPEYYSNMVLIVKSYLSTKEVNIATLAKFEKLWGSNAARNIKNFFTLPAARSFYGKFKGVPAIVVCAGPSLDDSIESIRKVSAKALLIAVDTAYFILRRHGITPDFTLCVDPQVINARYFEGDTENETILIADPTAHPSVFRLFKGKTAVTGMPFKSMSWASDIVGEKGEIAHGGSVSTNAYDFAKQLGAVPVIMIGQDLAFTGNLAHARGSYLDEQVHNKITRFYNAQVFNRRQLTALPKIFVKGIASPLVHTNQKMVIFLKWFEQRNDPSLINASCNGALIPNIVHKQLEDIEFQNDINKTLIRQIYQEEINALQPHLPELIEKGRDKTTRIINEMDALRERVAEAVRLSEELCRMMMQGKKSDRTNYILAKLNDVDAYIQSRSSASDMIGMTVQRVIHTITEGYDLEDDPSAGEDLKVARRSLYLYKGLKEGADFNFRIISKSRAMLER